MKERLLQPDNKRSTHKDPGICQLDPTQPGHHLTEPDPNFLFALLCGPKLSLDPEQPQRYNCSTLEHQPGILTLPIDTDQLVYQIASVADIEI